MGDLLLGLDVGTTATKALLFDLEGRVIASAQRNYSLLTPNEDWVEQDAEDLWSAAVETTRAVLERMAQEDRVAALSLSSQGGTTIPVDAEGQPVCQAISWMDNRAKEQARQIRDQGQADYIYGTTGWHLMNGLPLQHIRWLRQNRADIFDAARHFLFVNDFIAYRLTGRRCMNPSDASITQFLNIATGEWDKQLLEMAGVNRDQLSPVRPSGAVIGQLTTAASEATGLPPDVLVVNGAHDQYCAAVGTGVIEPGSVLLSCGTAWVILAVPKSLEIGLSSGMSLSCHAVPDRWGALHSLGGVGTLPEWVLDNVWGDKEAGEARTGLYAAMNEGVARSRPGAGGLLFCPVPGGYGLNASLVGFSLAHSRDDLTRAVMEGITFRLRQTIDGMREAGVEVAALTMVGGATESPVWPQIVADITGVEVSLPVVKQAASFGAAILAGAGAGLFADLSVGMTAMSSRQETLQPNQAYVSRYDDLYDKYRQAVNFLQGFGEGAV